MHSPLSIVRQRLYAPVPGARGLQHHVALRREVAPQAATGRDGPDARHRLHQLLVVLCVGEAVVRADGEVVRRAPPTPCRWSDPVGDVVHEARNVSVFAGVRPVHSGVPAQERERNHQQVGRGRSSGCRELFHLGDAGSGCRGKCLKLS